MGSCVHFHFWGCNSVHPEVQKFVEAFHEQMRKEMRDVQLNENEIRFLNDVFGPEFNYDFRGLKAQVRFTDYKGGRRYIDFFYERGVIRIIIEIDSLKYHVVSISHSQYDDHIERQNDLILQGGWILIRFTASMIRNQPMVCRRQLVQAVGKCLIQSQHPQLWSDEDIWRHRQQEIRRLAAERGVLKPAELAAMLNINRKTAAKYLHRVADAGGLQPIRKNKLITGYKLPGSGSA